MKIDNTSLCFGFKIEKDNDSGTPAWATSIGQAPKGVCYVETTRQGLSDFVYGLMYKSHSDFENLKDRGVPGLSSKEEPKGDRERMMFSVFDEVFVNNTRVEGTYVLTFEREHTLSHENRLHICYAKYLTYKDISNKTTLGKMAEALGCSEDACWFVSDIDIKGQTQLHFTAVVVNPTGKETYASSKERGNKWEEIIKEKRSKTFSPYRPYITAIKTKPFLLLAGISGTGKSRIVRELAKACWGEMEGNKPKNFEMVQVKPNWHDSSELIGYVSRVSGEATYVAGPFLKFIAKAWSDPSHPYFLCLDEMNLAPVEQYFAEYLSVIESRKVDSGIVRTDPILKDSDDWYRVLTSALTEDEKLRIKFLEEGISIPQNLIVVGTVNMDETTFSFSRKVLDRAMTIEMNEVDLSGGLTDKNESIAPIVYNAIVGDAVEGVDVYNNNKEVCDKVIEYLKRVNEVLEGTPFKIAYRTRNDFLLYVVNNLGYNKDKDGNEIDQNIVIARALDEITSMKILSRIEGDETKVGSVLVHLTNAIKNGLNTISQKEYADKKDDSDKELSISLAKLDEMKERLLSGYTSFWG